MAASSQQHVAVTAYVVVFSMNSTAGKFSHIAPFKNPSPTGATVSA